MLTRPPAPGRRRGPLRAILLVALALAALYLGAMLWLVSHENEILFRARGELGSRRPPFPYEQVDVPRDDGARQFAWVMPLAEEAATRPWVLYFHGNASTIASRGNIRHYEQLRKLGLNILAPEYRGYSGLDGEPSEPALAADARAAYEYLRTTRRVPPEQIVFYGWSLGSAVAVSLAAEVAEAALILEGAPASLADVGQLRYPLFPVRLLMRNPFDSIERIGRVGSPVLLLHSLDDTIIPIEEGRRLFEAARSPRRFVEVRGGHVFASEVDQAVFFGAIRQFLEEHGLMTGW